jgi:HD superfamily phosphodiesterase
VEHCRRSFQLAVLLAAARGLEVDVEVLLAGVLLHDLGLVPAYHSPTVRFEVASANAARAFVREHGMSGERAEKVWDVAALHATGGIAASPAPTSRLKQVGARMRRLNPAEPP